MSQLQWALEYVARGWAVMPCHWMALDENFDRACSCGADDCGSPGKHPRPRRGCHDATTDDVQVHGWWHSTWPNANIGIATGTVSCLYVIDLDGPDAIAEWAKLEPLGEPVTLAADTGGGGRHLYYHLPPTLRLPNTAKRIGAGIDTRGEGGYVLAPESNHRSGRAYTWRNWPCEPVPLPGWVLRCLATRPAPLNRPPAPIARAQRDDAVGLRILDAEMRTIATAQPGGRNDQLFKSAAAVFELVAGGDIRMESAWAGLSEAGRIAGLSEREVKATLASAVDAGREHPRRIRTRQGEPS